MIELKQVSFAYQGQEHDGLRDIDLTIADGECVLLCGRSGCGKTTITRLVNGLIPQFYQGELQGRVLVDGQEISSLPMYQIAAKVGSVFQNPRTQFFNVDTDSEIAFGIENEARPPRELAERVEQTTEDLRIQGLRGRNIFELSGGEKQKIAFASVYAMNPEIYLLDEPSSNLDMTSIQELREHLLLVKGQGKTILIAEHRLYYLMDIADRIVYLDRGEIKGIFTPEEFRRLSQAQREQMGLRATDLMDVLPPPGHAPIRGSMLSLNDVSLRYKRRTILHGIGLSAGRGEVIGVVGHNGAGKTTFSRALCGLHKDCDGQFQWDGGPMERRDRLKQSYMVMQDVNYELFAESVEAECSFGIRNPDKVLVDATLKELGLDGDSGQAAAFLADVLGEETRGEGLGIAMSDQISGALTVNLGIIRGGGEELSLTLDLRWPVTARYEDFADRLMGAMERGGFAGERTEGQDSIYMPPESPLVQALSKVYREQTGQEAELLSIGGGTYAKACPNLVAFGPLFPGQEMTEHQPDEYMEADTLLKNAQMMAAAIWELAR